MENAWAFGFAKELLKHHVKFLMQQNKNDCNNSFINTVLLFSLFPYLFALFQLLLCLLQIQMEEVITIIVGVDLIKIEIKIILI